MLHWASLTAAAGCVTERMRTSTTPRRYDIVVVNWHHGSRLDACLASLPAAIERAAAAGFLRDRVVVVDNGSEPRYQPAQVPNLPITLIRNPQNLGFAVACTQGAAGSRADWLLFLNPDTRLSEDALAHALARFEDPDGGTIGMIGLPLVDERGGRQASCGRFLTSARVFCQLTGLSLIAPARFPGFRMSEWPHDQTRDVDYVSAACMIVRRPLFETLGGFDPRFVVYLEDADLAWRARRGGWRTVFLDGPPVYHEGGWSTGRARVTRLSEAWRSLIVYGWKHFDAASAAVVTVEVLVVAPLARLTQALLHGSPREFVEACGGYARLWLLLGQLLARPASRSRGMAAARSDAPDSPLV
jgi:N-acetylglucosaminyl-diphospho-decaprenol L-rhamnosyltransferase